MTKSRKVLVAGMVLAGLEGIRAIAAPHVDPVTEGLRTTVKLLVLMETDGGGKVPKAEFMKYMENEFDRLDANKNGELDVKELTQPRYYVHGGTHR